MVLSLNQWRWFGAILVFGYVAVASSADEHLTETTSTEVSDTLDEKRKLIQELDVKRQNFSQALSEFDEAIIRSEDSLQKIEQKIAKAKERHSQLETLQKMTQERTQEIHFQLKKQLLQSYLDESAGIGPALVGIESFEDYMLRHYISERLAKKNAELRQGLQTVLNVYETQKKEIASLVQQLKIDHAILKNKTELIKKAQEERREVIQKIAKARSLKMEEIKQLNERYVNIPQVIQNLTAHPTFPEKNDSILKWKGLLDWPASGDILIANQQKNAIGFLVPLQGVFIRRSRADFVRAIFQGQIVFAGFMKGFGRTIIIDHGNGVHSVYAHLDRILVNFGSTVSRGKSIGSIGDAKSETGAQLYFELRQNGIPQNVFRWLQEKIKPSMF